MNYIVDRSRGTPRVWVENASVAPVHFFTYHDSTFVNYVIMKFILSYKVITEVREIPTSISTYIGLTRIQKVHASVSYLSILYYSLCLFVFFVCPITDYGFTNTYKFYVGNGSRIVSWTKVSTSFACLS